MFTPSKSKAISTQCQAIVKALFADRDFAQRASLSGVNSINWARIVAQAVYFHVAAHALSGAPGAVNFIVPTGNFGDAYSGYVAKKLGAPIGKILLATNANDILARALNTGRYERAATSQATLSPAMDIQVASNFERFVFEGVDRDAGLTRQFMQQFAQSGGFDIAAISPSRRCAPISPPLAVDDAETLRKCAPLARRRRRACMSAHGRRPARRAARSGFAARACRGRFRYMGAAHRHSRHRPSREISRHGRARDRRSVRSCPPSAPICFRATEKFDTLPADAEAVKRYIRERSRAWS